MVCRTNARQRSVIEIQGLLKRDLSHVFLFPKHLVRIRELQLLRSWRIAGAPRLRRSDDSGQSKRIGLSHSTRYSGGVSWITSEALIVIAITNAKRAPHY